MKKVLIFLLFPCQVLFAQQELSATIDEFCLQVNDILTPEQVDLVRQVLPAQGDVYGYAVGDFSGDYLPDLAVSVRTKELRGKKVKLFYFVSDEGQFLEVRENVLEFYDVPIEIGFTIENGVCYTTQKIADNNWTIHGYAYREGNFFLVDSYESARRHLRIAGTSEIGYEITKNFTSLVTNELYYNIGTRKQYLNAEYYTFPAYPIEKNIHPYYNYVVRDTSRKFIVGGDSLPAVRGGFETAVFYDDAYLYFFAWVSDSCVRIDRNSWERSDHVQLWFDTGRSAATGFRTEPDDSVFMFAAAPTKSEDDPQRVDVRLQHPPTAEEREAIDNIRVQSDMTMNGYTLRIRIPFGLYGGRDRLRSTIGYTLVLHDVAGEGGRSASTELATSRFTAWNPSTFGRLDVMNDGAHYGEVIDLNTSEMIRMLVFAGIDAL